MTLISTIWISPKDSLVIVFEWKNTIPSNSGRPNPTFTLTGILLTNDTPGISYSSIGINGANVPAYLACKNLERDLKFLKPDLLILSIGLNDANVDDFDEKLFRAHYDTLISRIKSVAPQVAILFTTNNDSYRRDKQKNFLLHPNGEIARQAFFTMATQYHAGIWDMFSLMGGLGSMEQWEKADLAKNDRVHFNYAGYNLLGNFFYQALMEAYTTTLQSSKQRSRRNDKFHSVLPRQHFFL
jgi:lysophospholipase L1-like esterase